LTAQPAYRYFRGKTGHRFPRWSINHGLGDVKQFPSVRAAISYCGFCGAERSSASVAQRTPISKQRNPHLQTVLVEAAKLAPRWNADLAPVYEKEKQKGNYNRATLAVARKLMAYLLAVDRGETANGCLVQRHAGIAAERQKRGLREPKCGGFSRSSRARQEAFFAS